ncbi:MAG TPA: LUD domain-containing protein, partial [Candidatus Paceibacterota bacterium]|nr:LUD domain-containing protein [Candidatus Paceibacterota bacterium]
MDYTTIPSSEIVQKTADSLKANNFEPIIVTTKEEALAKIKELIPAGASVMNGASTTLEQIGYIEYLKSGRHGWDNLHEKILNEKDPAMQSLLRRQMVVSDFYLGSAHAVSQTGELVFGSNTGSQLPGLAFTA